MLIDKFALWSPLVLPPRVPSSTDRAVTALERIAAAVNPTPVPGKTAFALCTALGGVRDAITDAKSVDAASTNAQLDTALRSRRVVKAIVFLKAHRPALERPYAEQFRHLAGSGAVADPERRDRLAELVAFEQHLMRDVPGDQAI